MLPDQTLLQQNTATLSRVRISRHERELEVNDGGEVLLEVAPDARGPFVIRAGDLDVRAESGTVWVKSVEGGAWRVAVLVNAAEVHRRSGGIRKVSLRAGDVATFGLRSVSFRQQSRQQLSRGAGWTADEIWLAGETLAEAVAEINRYSTTTLVIRDSQTASLRVGGRFYTGDVEQFVKALQALRVEAHAAPPAAGGDTVIVLSAPRPARAPALSTTPR